jgi:hypothetical protein
MDDGDAMEQEPSGRNGGPGNGGTRRAAHGRQRRDLADRRTLDPVYPQRAIVTVAAAGVAGIAAAWIVTTRRRQATAERYLGTSGTGGLGPRGIRVRQDAIEAEVRTRFGPELAQVATGGAWRLPDRPRSLLPLRGGSVRRPRGRCHERRRCPTACLVLSVALCIASIAATLTGMTDGKAAQAWSVTPPAASAMRVPCSVSSRAARSASVKTVASRHTGASRSSPRWWCRGN